MMRNYLVFLKLIFFIEFFGLLEILSNLGGYYDGRKYLTLDL